MALPRLSASDNAATTRDKINAGLTASDANAAAIAQERSDRENQDAVLDGRIKAVEHDREAQDAVLADRIQGAISDREIQDAALQRQINDAAAKHDADVTDLRGAIQVAADRARTSALAAIYNGSRPGLVPTAFGLSATPSAPPGAAPALVQTTFGMVARIDGPGVLAPVATIPCDGDFIWILRAQYLRLVDVIDPNNSAVDIGIQWFDAARGDLGQTLLRREATLSVSDGQHTLTQRVPSASGERPAVVAPKGAMAWRPYIRAWGGGAVGVTMLGGFDATFASFYAPDVYALAADLRTIQGQIAAGLPFSTPILPSYAVAELPRPGSRGRKAFAADGRAPNAAGALEAANAGTGVEVTDNGTSWVITGTNQQVQA